MTELILIGDALEKLKEIEDGTVDCCVTSPPYFNLRDYGVDGQIGIEDTPEAYVSKLVCVFREVKRVLRDDGTLWVNIGDSYNGSGKAGKHPEYQSKHTEFGKPSIHKERFGLPTNIKGLKPKDLIGVPWMLAFALRADGWYLRQDIIWAKTNPMPESIKDRCTKSHEYIFLLSKLQKYYYDADAISEPSIHAGETRTRNDNRIDAMGKYGQTRGGFRGETTVTDRRNKRDVWRISLTPYKGAHFATFPQDLIKPCILAGSREGGIVLDPFMGSGTTCMVAKKHGRGYIGIELNPEYVEIAKNRIYEGTKNGLQLAMDGLAV